MNKGDSRPHKKLAITLLVTPCLVVAGSFIMMLTINLIFNPTFWMTPDTKPVTPTPFLITALNGVLLTIGALGLLMILPGLAAGLYLLTKKRLIAK